VKIDAENGDAKSSTRRPLTSQTPQAALKDTPPRSRRAMTGTRPGNEPRVSALLIVFSSSRRSRGSDGAAVGAELRLRLWNSVARVTADRTRARAVDDRSKIASLLEKSRGCTRTPAACGDARGGGGLQRDGRDRRCSAQQGTMRLRGGPSISSAVHRMFGATVSGGGGPSDG